MREVDAATAMTWLQKGEACMIDVREPAEFAAGHVRGAQLLPLGEVASASVTLRDGEKLVLFCRSGRRSLIACTQLMEKGLDAYSLADGIAGWEAAGGALEVPSA